MTENSSSPGVVLFASVSDLAIALLISGGLLPEYYTLAAGQRESLRPANPLEDHLVDTVITCLWHVNLIKCIDAADLEGVMLEPNNGSDHQAQIVIDIGGPGNAAAWLQRQEDEYRRLMCSALMTLEELRSLDVRTPAYVH